MKILHCFLLGLVLYSCGEDPLPKPKAYLRLDYPPAQYQEVRSQLPFTFEKNTLANQIDSIKTSGELRGVDIKYPRLKATLYLTYKGVTQNNLMTLLRDAQNLTQKHTIKADEITSAVYENDAARVYGMLYEVGGDAASQSQFYLTDSINHFLSGSLYFYAKPNYDSIYPASEYLKKDIKRLMESVKWKD
jgi:gliding motility-associated lipoprotein GldD